MFVPISLVFLATRPLCLCGASNTDLSRLYIASSYSPDSRRVSINASVSPPHKRNTMHQALRTAKIYTVTQ